MPDRNGKQFYIRSVPVIVHKIFTEIPEFAEVVKQLDAHADAFLRSTINGIRTAMRFVLADFGLDPPDRTFPAHIVVHNLSIIAPILVRRYLQDSNLRKLGGRNEYESVEYARELSEKMRREFHEQLLQLTRVDGTSSR